MQKKNVVRSLLVGLMVHLALVATATAASQSLVGPSVSTEALSAESTVPSASVEELAEEQLIELWFEHGPLGEIASPQRLEALRIMKESWPLFSKYESYLLPLASDEDLLAGVVSLRTHLSQGGVMAYRPLVGDFPEHMHPQISVTIPHYLDKDGQPTDERFGTGFADPSKAVCIVLSDYGDVVPLDAARQAMQGFIEGFVTRLMIGSLVNDWADSGMDIDPKAFGLTLRRSPVQSELMKVFLKKDSYVVDESTGSVSFEDKMPMLLQRHSLHAHGLLTGWQAASDLELKRGRADEIVLDAARVLVAGRFSSYEQGHICSATLNYFFGLTWATSARLEMMRRQAEGPLATHLTKEQMQQFRAESNEQVLQNVSNDPKVNQARALLNQLGDLFDDYLAALSENEEMEAIELSLLVDELRDFNRGWRHGATQAMEESFRIVFRTAADLAYVEGWGDGFTKGYADGYRDGYAVGYQEAWDKANVVIASLTKQVNDLKRQNATLGSQLARMRDDNRNLTSNLRRVEARHRALQNRFNAQITQRSRGGNGWSRAGRGLGKAAGSFIGEATGFGTAKRVAKKLKFW